MVELKASGQPEHWGWGGIILFKVILVPKKKKKVKILPFLRKMDPAKNPEHSEQSEFSSKLREAALQPLESLGLRPSYLS